MNFDWFQQQSRRDQIALLVLGVSLALYLIWMLGVKPLAAATENSRNQYRAAAESLARVKSMATTLQYHQQNTTENSGAGQVNLAGLINSTTRANSLSFATLNPSRDGNEATVRFDNVPLENIIQWVYQLETTHGAHVKTLNLNAANQPGQVLVTVSISKPQ